VNENHAKLMPSPEWAAHIQDEVLPQATADVELGGDLLELGPGPGAHNLIFTARKENP